MNPLDENPGPGDAGPGAQVPDEEDHTVMVDRGASPSTAGADEDEHTVMVDRKVAPDEEDHTVMVDRGAAPEEEDHTVVVGRAPKNKRAAPLEKRVTAARRRGISPPPVPTGFAPQAVEAVGVGATEIYRPRAIPEAPPPAVEVPRGPDATREASATMPSVARHSRVTARVAIVVFVTSCLASAVGLTLIALNLF